MRLLLRHRESEVLLEVENRAGPGSRTEGRGSAEAPRGLGLLGMRERAQLVGAELEAGPIPSGGWRVRLALPVSRETSTGGTGDTKGRSTD